MAGALAFPASFPAQRQQGDEVLSPCSTAVKAVCLVPNTALISGNSTSGIVRGSYSRRALLPLPARTRKVQAVAADGNAAVPEEFYKVEAIVRPWRLNLVAAALLRAGIRGVTVTDVRGFGAQGGSRERQAGSEFTEDSFVSKVKLEIVVSQEQVETVVDIVIEEARTGEIGDGKIFVSPVADIVRIRTGERGLKAERMAGGRAELLSSHHEL